MDTSGLNSSGSSAREGACVNGTATVTDLVNYANNTTAAPFNLINTAFTNLPQLERLFLGGGGSTAQKAAAGPKIDPVLQAAYADVAGRMSQSDGAIKSDYAATVRGANRGNARDVQKIAVYKKLRPDLFGSTPVSARAANVSNWKDLSF